MKYTFLLVVLSIFLHASLASATGGFVEDGEEQDSQASSQQNSLGLCTPKRPHAAISDGGAPRRRRSSPVLRAGAIPVRRMLFQSDPVVLPGSPEANQPLPPLWQPMAAAAAAEEEQVPAAMPRDLVDAQQELDEQQEEQEYLAYQAAIDEEQAVAEDQDRADELRAHAEEAIRLLLERQRFGAAPCRDEERFAPYFGF